jgi:uncharacterized membrane protein
MRASLSSLVLLSSVALSGCFISENAGPAHACSANSDCPSAYHCVSVSAEESTCEVIYPPVFAESDAGTPSAGSTDAGTPDAGPVPTWCNDVQPVLAASCVQSCHGATTTGSGHSEFRLDMYADNGAIKGAKSMAARIQARAVDQKSMPPAGSTAPSAADLKVLSRWVAGGTPQCFDGGTP